MGKKHETKTNAMRLLDAAHLEYESHTWDCPEALSGIEVAQLLDEDPDHVFKTLVTTGKSGEHYVFMIPVAENLDLKKAALAVGEKSIEMLPLKELFPLTGYVHGGCSPLGMKKQFVTCIDETAELFDTVIFSGGRLGLQIECPLSHLQTLVDIKLTDLCA